VADGPEVPEHYSAHYREFAAGVYAEARRAAYVQDVGQNSYLTVDELDRFAVDLQLGSSSRLLDVACGSGGPALHLVQLTGCQVVGVELYDEAVSCGNDSARRAGLEDRASFVRADASQPLPLETGAFDAIVCVDSIHHLAGREQVLADWARLLGPGGRLLFTDPVVITGVLDSDELAIRTSIGYIVFVPLSENERLLTVAGLSLLAVRDTTDEFAVVARRRSDARSERAQALRRVEGDQAFDGRQRFFDLVAKLAFERRLGRFVFLAEKPTS
jgi:SAM-dependent methyltransferase